MNKQNEQSKLVVILLVVIAGVGGFFTQVKGPRAENQELKAKQEKVSGTAQQQGPTVKPDGGTLAASRLLTKPASERVIMAYVEQAARRNNVRLDKVAPVKGPAGNAATVQGTGDPLDVTKFARDVGSTVYLTNGQLRVRKPALGVSGLSVTENSDGAVVKFTVSALGG